MCSENNRLRAIKTRKHQTFYLVAQEQHRLSPAKTFTHNLKEKQALGKSQNQNLKTQGGTPWLALPLRDNKNFLHKRTERTSRKTSALVHDAETVDNEIVRRALGENEDSSPRCGFRPKKASERKVLAPKFRKNTGC
jgi:hypothetical protein